MSFPGPPGPAGPAQSNAPAPGYASGPPQIPPGWPSQYGPYGMRRRPWAPDVRPGKFVWMDLVTVLAYGALFLVGLGSFIIAVPGMLEVAATITGTEPATAQQLTTEPESPASSAALFVVNLFNYAVMFTLGLIACWRHLIASFATFRSWWGAKLALIPGIWLATIILSAIFVALLGEPVTSENQAALEGMTTVVPAWLMILVTVIMGPFVEEYVFRHLMIGKLSRYLTVWVTVPLSIITFASIHFLGSGNMDLVALVPYLVLAVAITITYLVFKFSLAYVYILHLFNNLVSVVVLYLAGPLLEDLEEFQETAGMLTAPLRLLGLL